MFRLEKIMEGIGNVYKETGKDEYTFDELEMYTILILAKKCKESVKEETRRSYYEDLVEVRFFIYSDRLQKYMLGNNGLQEALMKIQKIL